MSEKNCQKCFASNPEDATFCKQCGTNIANPYLKKKSDSSEILVIIGLALILFSTFYFIVMPFLFSDWWYNMRIIYVIGSLVGSAGPILIAISIKNSASKIIFIILGVIFALWSIISQITNYFLY